MAAARRMLAIALSVLPALLCAGMSEEPVCETDGNNITCVTPPGQSVLQRTLHFDGHSLNVTEEEDKEAGATPSACGDNAWLSWKLGDGIGGTETLIGNMLKESCVKACAKKRLEDSAVNGCTWSHSKMQCWAEKGMTRWTRSGDWITTFLPPPCKKVEIIALDYNGLLVSETRRRTKILPPATKAAYNSLPCSWKTYQVTLHTKDDKAIASGPIRLAPLMDWINTKALYGVYIECTGADKSICENAKKGFRNREAGYYIVFDGPGAQCPEKDDGNWDDP